MGQMVESYPMNSIGINDKLWSNYETWTRVNFLVEASIGNYKIEKKDFEKDWDSALTFRSTSKAWQIPWDEVAGLFLSS